jgi:Uma2 family endonuclease
LADGFAPPHPQPDDGMTRRRLTVSELDAMFDAGILSRGDKLELIEGELIEMNSQMMLHARLKTRLAMRLASSMPTGFEVVVEGSTILSELTLVDPDIVVISNSPIERRYISRDEAMLAIEVSDTTLHYDLGLKAGLYAAAGIRELWVLDVSAKTVWVHRVPSGKGYQSVVQIAFDQPMSSLIEGTDRLVVADLLT